MGNISNLSNDNILVSIIKIIVWSTILILIFQLSQNFVISQLFKSVIDKIDFSDTTIKASTILVTTIFIIWIIFKSRKYEKLDNNTTVLLFVFIIVYSCYKYWINHPIWSFSNLFTVTYPVTFNIEYGDIIYLIALAHLSVYIKILFSKKKTSTLESKDIQKISDAPIYKKEEDKFDYYTSANNLMSRIIDNPDYYSKRALCIGIEAAWGSGKTSFINLMQSAVESDSESDNYQKAIIVKFSPWFSNNSEQITQDFMTTISNALSTYNPNIASELDKYSRILTGADLGWFSKILKMYFGNNVKPLEKQFDELSNKISQIKMPVIVFIDDIDRLHTDEIMRVLNLIRNTANFKNTIFVAAYDKKYVLSEIKKDVAFLEKIFTTPYSFPHINDNSKLLFISELFEKTLLANKEEVKSIELFLEDIENSLSIRNAKRFLNKVTVSRQRLLLCGLEDLYLYDLLLIEYLQFEFDEIYRILSNSGINRILNESKESFTLNNDTSGKRISDNDFITQYISPVVGEKKSGKTAFKILELLFSNPISIYNNRHLNPYRIRYTEIFKVYFKISKGESLVNQKEFDKTITSKDNSFEDSLTKWFKEKDWNLIFRLFENVRFSNESEGIELLNRSLAFIPGSFKDVYEIFGQRGKSLFLLGSNYIQQADYGYEYQYLYLKILRTFFENIKSKDILTVNKKLFLLFYVKDESKFIFANKPEDVSNENSYERFSKVYLSYLKHYLSFKPSFDSFEISYMNYLTDIFYDSKQQAKQLLREYIAENLENFAKNARNLNELTRHFELDKVFSSKIDELNEDSSQWLVEYRNFLDTQPDVIKKKDWFIKHRTMVHS